MSEKAERRRLRRQLNEEKILRDKLISELLRRPDGRDFLWWLLQVSKFGTQPFSTDPHVTAFACGELNVGQQIYASIIEADPAGFLRMQQEINDARRTPPDPEPGADSAYSGTAEDA